MTRDETDVLVLQAAKYVKKHPHIRYGQAVFNLLYESFPELADEIRGGGLDPFHHDDRVPQLIDWLNR